MEEGGCYPLFGVGNIVAFNAEFDMEYPRSYISFAIPLIRGTLWRDYEQRPKFGRVWLRLALIIQNYPDQPSNLEFRSFLDIPHG